MFDHDHILDWFQGLGRHIHESKHLGPLTQIYPRDSDPAPDWNKVYTLYYTPMNLLRTTLDNAYVDLMVQAIDEYIQRDLGVPPWDLEASPEARESLVFMKDQGYTYLPPLDADTVATMSAHFESQPVHPWAYAKDDTECTLDEAREGKFACYSQERVLACPHLLDIANDPAVLSVVEGYFGTLPTIQGLSAWWSFADTTGATEAQLFHMDIDDLKFCKLFIYLTDVDEESGPHTYLGGSHDLEFIHGLRGQWPGGGEEFNPVVLPPLRKTDGQVKRIFGRDPTHLTGARGTRFVADTFGIHKGVPPKKGERLVCQVLYGVTPPAQGAYRAPAHGLGSHLSHPRQRHHPALGLRQQVVRAAGGGMSATHREGIAVGTTTGARE